MSSPFAIDGSACIRFPVTQSIYDRWAETNPDLFELLTSNPFNAHLVLYCAPEDYKPVMQDLGSTDIASGYSQAVIVPAARLYGFEISTIESRPAAFYTLDLLRRNATKINGVYQAIEVWDAHHLHDTGSTQTLHGQAYCVRKMRMQSLAPQGGSLWTGGDRYSASGFTVRLMELNPRDVY